MKQFLLTLIAVAALVGCGGETEAVQSGDWYKENSAERKDMIAKCKSNEGELSGSPNCVNAKQAQNETDNARRGWVQPNPIN